MTKVGAKVPAVVKTDASRSSVLGASRMPSVLHQSQLSADSTSGEGRIFSRFFNEYRAVTTPTPGEDPGIKRASRFFRGGSPRLVDWEGKKADFIGIEPVHQEWTIVDGGLPRPMRCLPRRISAICAAPLPPRGPMHLRGVASRGTARAPCRSCQEAHVSPETL